MGHKFQGHPLLLKSQNICSEGSVRLLGGLKIFVLYIVFFQFIYLQFIRKKIRTNRFAKITGVCVGGGVGRGGELKLK